MRGSARKLTASIVLAVTLGACGTPEPVRELATRTAANTSQVGSQLKKLDAASENVALARATNVARLKDTVRDVRGRHTLDIALTKKSGDSRSLAQKDEIAQWIVEARAAAHGMTVQEFKARQGREPVDPFSADIEAIMAGLETLDTKATELSEVSKTLAELSKEDDLKARTQFLIEYVKTVRKEVEEKEAAAAKSAEAAKSTAKNASKEAGATAGK